MAIGVIWDHKIFQLDNNLANLAMATEGSISGNFGRPFWRYSLFCSFLKKVYLDLAASQGARCSLERATSGSRAIGPHR